MTFGLVEPNSRLVGDLSNGDHPSLERISGPDLRKILLVSDVYPAQACGLGPSYKALTRTLSARGHQVKIIQTDDIKSTPIPFRPELRINFRDPNASSIHNAISQFNPDHIHIATEAPFGIAHRVRKTCLNLGLHFTSAVHTLWPEFVREHFKLLGPLRHLAVGFTWRYMRWFHGAADQVMTRSEDMVRMLEAKGFSKVVKWQGGVDPDIFRPDGPIDSRLQNLPKPVHMYVGRVSLEKGIGRFLEMPIQSGSKVVIGDGSQLAQLKKQYPRDQFPDIHFFGHIDHAALPALFRGADVFVFTSKTDTFGLVMIEALACGVPVAAFPVTGPREIVTTPGVGAMNEDLSVAVRRALAEGDREICRRHALNFSQDRVADQFFGNLVPVSKRQRGNTSLTTS